jgi:hypothetical protein
VELVGSAADTRTQMSITDDDAREVAFEAIEQRVAAAGVAPVGGGEGPTPTQFTDEREDRADQQRDESECDEHLQHGEAAAASHGVLP